MGLLKFGVCVVTWILCASKTNGNNTTLFNSGSECIEGHDLPSVGPCNKCVCTQGKVSCINVECGYERKKNETRSDTASTSLFEKMRPPENVFNETRRHQIDVITKEPYNDALPNFSSVITIEKTGVEIPTASTILTKTHADNVFKTFLNKSYDSDKYILIVPEVSTGKKKHLQKRDVYLISDIRKNKLHSDSEQLPPQEINVKAHNNDSSKWPENVMIIAPIRRHAEQPLTFGNKSLRTPRDPLRNNHISNQHSMVASRLEQRQISGQHKMVSSRLEKKKISQHHQTVSSRLEKKHVSKKHNMVSSRLEKKHHVSKQHKMISSRLEKKQFSKHHYQMSHAQKKSSNYKFSYKSKSKFRGETSQGTRVTQAPKLNFQTPGEAYPFPQSKFVEPKQPVIKKPKKKIKQPMPDYDPINMKHIVPESKHPPVPSFNPYSPDNENIPDKQNIPNQYLPTHNDPSYGNSFYSDYDNPLDLQTPKNKNKLQPNSPKNKTHKPKKGMKPNNLQKPSNLNTQTLNDIPVMNPDIGNIPPLHTPQSKTHFSQLPLHGEPQIYPDNFNEPFNKPEKHPKLSNPKNYNPDDENVPKPFTSRNKRFTTKVPKIFNNEPEINADYNHPLKPKYKPKQSDDYSSGKISNEEEMSLDYENYDYSLTHKKSTTLNPLYPNEQPLHKPKQPYNLNPDQVDNVPDINHPTAPIFSSKGKKPTGNPVNPDYNHPLKPKYKPKQSDDYNSGKLSNEEEMSLDYENYDYALTHKKYTTLNPFYPNEQPPYKPKEPYNLNPDKVDSVPDINHPAAPFLPSKGKKPTGNPVNPDYNHPLKPKYKPKQSDDYSSGKISNEEEMSLDYENYDYALTNKKSTTLNPFYPNEQPPYKPKQLYNLDPDKADNVPDISHPSAPFFPSKGKKPTGNPVNPDYDHPLKPKQSHDYSSGKISNEEEMSLDYENYDYSLTHKKSTTLNPFYPNEQPPYKPKQPYNLNPDKVDNVPDINHPSAPFFPSKGKKPTGNPVNPDYDHPLKPKYKPKQSHDYSSGKISNEEEMSLNYENYDYALTHKKSTTLNPFYPNEQPPYKPKQPYNLNPDKVDNVPDINHPSAPFLPSKGKKPTGKIPQSLKPLLGKFPYKPKRPPGVTPDAFDDEPEIYPDIENYPLADDHPLAPFFPKKGKKPTGEIPKLLKPLSDKFPYKPKRPDDSNPDSRYSEEPEMDPSFEIKPIPDNYPVAPFLSNKSKKPKGKVPQFSHKPKRPNDQYPDSHNSNEPILYPDDENYPLPDNHPLAPIFPNNGKKPKGTTPQFLKPLDDKFPHKPKQPADSNPDSHYPEELEMYPNYGDYPNPKKKPFASFLPNKAKNPTENIPELFPPKKSPYKPNGPDDFNPDSHHSDEPEMYPADENYPLPVNHPLAPIFPNKGKKPKGTIPQFLKPLDDKFPYKPQLPGDPNPDSHYPEKPEMYPNYYDYPNPKKSPFTPFLPKKAKKPTGNIPELFQPKKSPYKPNRPDDFNPDSHHSDEPEMYPADENYPLPDNHPLAPIFPNKGKKPKGTIPQFLKPLDDKFPYKPKQPANSNPDSHYPEELEMYPNYEDYPYPKKSPFAPFLPNKAKKPTGNIPELFPPKKSPYKPNRPDDFNPDSHHSDEPEMYPADENYPLPDNHPLAPIFPNQGKKPKGTIPQFLKPLDDKFPHKPKQPANSNPDSHYPEEPEMYPNYEDYPNHKKKPFASFLPNKAKIPTGNIPELFPPKKSPYKPNSPDDFNPDSHHSDEPEMYPADENYPLPDNHPLAPIFPNKGKNPKGTIPQFLKPLDDKFPYKPKLPGDSNLDSHYPEEPEMYPNYEDYPNPKKNPFASFLPNKAKNIPELFPPKKSPYKPNRPDDFNPDSHHSDEPEMYPADENYPLPDNHPLAPIFPNKGKKPKGTIPQFLKPLDDKIPYKPKLLGDSNPDSHYSEELEIYPNYYDYPNPKKSPFTPFRPNKAKKPTGNIPELFPPKKSPYKPNSPDDFNPDSHHSDEPEMYPADANYPLPDNHPLAPIFPNKGKSPKGTKPQFSKPLDDTFPYKPKLPGDSNPDSHYPAEPEMYPNYYDYPNPKKSPFTPVRPKKAKKPTGNIPELFQPKKSPYKPNSPDDFNPDSHHSDEPEMYPADENYPLPDNHPLAPIFPNKGKKPKGTKPQFSKPLDDKFPYKPKLLGDSNPDSHYPEEPEMYPNYYDYPNPKKSPFTPFRPKKAKKPTENIPELFQPKKSPYKPNSPDDFNPDSHHSDEPEMYPADENYPLPDNHPLAPIFPNKGKKPKGTIPQFLKPLDDKFPHKPKQPADSDPESHYPEEPEMYPNYEDNPNPKKNPFASFLPNKAKKPTENIPELLPPKKSPYKPNRPDDFNPDSHHSDEPEMYPDDENYPFPGNHPVPPFFPNNGKKPSGKLPDMKPLFDKFSHKPKRPDDSYPDSRHSDEPKRYPEDENYPFPDNHPLAPFFPNKGKKPRGKNPKLLKPLLDEFPHKPDDSNPNPHYSEEPEMYPDYENYPIPDNHPLALLLPYKGKRPTGNIPDILKPLLEKFKPKPKRPDGSKPDPKYSKEPEMYPDYEDYPIPDNHPLAPLLPYKGKRPRGKIPEFLKPLLIKLRPKPKRPNDSHPDPQYSEEPEMYPEYEDYPIPDNHPLAPLLPYKGKRPRGKIPEFLKPLLIKLRPKPKGPNDSHPDPQYSEEPEMYPEYEDYPIPDNHPLAPLLPNKGKIPTGKIPEFLKLLLIKLRPKPKRPDDSNPNPPYSEEPETYPNYEDYPIPDNHPLAPLLPHKGKRPTGKIPEFLKPLLIKLRPKPKRPNNSNPISHYSEEPEMYPDYEDYPIPGNHPLAPLLPNKGKRPTGKIPEFLKPLLIKLRPKPKRPNDSNPNLHYSQEAEMYSNYEDYPIPDNHPLAPLLPHKGKRPTGKIPEILKPLLIKLRPKPKRPNDSNPISHYSEEPEMYPEYEDYPIPENHPLAPLLPNKGKRPTGKIPEFLIPLLIKLRPKPKHPIDPKYKGKNPKEPKLYPDYKNEPSLNTLSPKHPLDGRPFNPKKGKNPIDNIPKILKPKKYPTRPKGPVIINPIQLPFDLEPEKEPDYEFILVDDDYHEIYKGYSLSNFYKLEELICKRNSVSDNIPFDNSHEPSSEYLNPLLRTTPQYKPINLLDNSQEFVPGDEKPKNIPSSFSANSHEPLKLSFKPYDENKPEYGPDSFPNNPNEPFQFTTPQYEPNSFNNNDSEQPMPFDDKEPHYRPNSINNNSLEQSFQLSYNSSHEYKPNNFTGNNNVFLSERKSSKLLGNEQNYEPDKEHNLSSNGFEMQNNIDQKELSKVSVSNSYSSNKYKSGSSSDGFKSLQKHETSDNFNHVVMKGTKDTELKAMKYEWQATEELTQNTMMNNRRKEMLSSNARNYNPTSFYANPDSLNSARL